MGQTLYAVNQYPIQILFLGFKQVRELIDSLYKGYPVGYLIAWKNRVRKITN